MAAALVTAGPAALAAPAIRSVRILTPRVERYARFEMAADITRAWDNPYDPGEIDVQAEILAPGGCTLRVPAFWYEPYAEESPASRPRQSVRSLKLFVTRRDWPPSSPLELLVDDVALLDSRGREVPVDDMERGEAPRWHGYGGARVAWSEQTPHSGRRALSLGAEAGGGKETWPSAVLPMPGADWRAYRGLVAWVYPRVEGPVGPVYLAYEDASSATATFRRVGERGGELRPNRWNRLVWRWRNRPPAVTLVPRGRAEWRVRFTPSRLGRYQVRLAARAGGASAASPWRSFTVTPSRDPGFVRVSRRDPRYFAFDSGKPFFPIGHDVPWGLPDARAYFPKMRAHGENATYFIMMPHDTAIEWRTLGSYDQERAARLDRVVEAARRNGVYLKLSFDVHGALRPSADWKDNPYNVARGGPCAGPNDFYTSEAAWRYYARRVRYIAARWGYSPNIMAWEPVAELDGGTQLDGQEGWDYPRRANSEKLSAALGAFLRRLARHLASVDPYDRLFTTSYSSEAGDENHWRLPEVDYTQIHAYSTPDAALTLGHRVREMTARYVKPTMVTEFGWDNQADPEGLDPTGICLHNGLWASVASGASGGALAWWWEFIDRHGLYRAFPPLRAFAVRIDWPGERFRPVPVQATVPGQGRRTVATAAFGGIGGFGDARAGPFAVDAHGKLAGEERPPAYLLARGRGKERVVPRFAVDYPHGGTFTVHVGRAFAGPRLEIRVDNAVACAVDLPARDVPGKLSARDPQWNAWYCDYREGFTARVPPGRHEIAVENAAPTTSWIQVMGYALTRVGPPSVRALGLAGRGTIVLWVRNRASIWVNWDQPEPEPIHGTQLTVPARDGAWRVEWWDTWRGRVVRRESARAERGRLRLTAPAFRRDIACRITRDGAGR